MAAGQSWKSPPKAKVYEALSAVVDGRVEVGQDHQAKVWSSDRSKAYTVVWTANKDAFGANDNASYWVGYIGYPIIAVLLRLDLLPYREDLAGHLRDINWNALNKAYKRDYDAAVNYVLDKVDASTAEIVRSYASEVFAALKDLKLGKILPPGEPPKR